MDLEMLHSLCHRWGLKFANRIASLRVCNIECCFNLAWECSDGDAARWETCSSGLLTCPRWYLALRTLRGCVPCTSASDELRDKLPRNFRLNGHWPLKPLKVPGSSLKLARRRMLPRPRNIPERLLRWDFAHRLARVINFPWKPTFHEVHHVVFFSLPLSPHIPGYVLHDVTWRATLFDLHYHICSFSSWERSLGFLKKLGFWEAAVGSTEVQRAPCTVFGSVGVAGWGFR